MSQPTFGSKASVWHGNAKKTVGNLTKKNLMKNKNGHIVSRRKHALGKKSIKRLQNLGFRAKKGVFKLFRKGDGKSSKRGGGLPQLGYSKV
jgi:hypothetical protein